MALDLIHPSKGPGTEFGKSLLQLADAPALRTAGGLDVAPFLGKPTGTSGLHGITDWNDVTTPGHSVQLMLGTQTNGPGDANYYYVEVRQYAGTSIVQIGHQYEFSGSKPSTIMRTRQAGVWSSWRRIFAAGDKPAFSAHNGAAVSGNNQLVPFSTILTNIGGCYNSSTSAFTAPVAGTYQFTASIMSYNTAGSVLNAQFAYNGSYRGGQSYSYNVDADHQYVSLSIVMSMAAGDYMQLYSALGVIYTDYRQFTGFLI